MSAFCWWCGGENRGPQVKATIDGNTVRVHKACKEAAEQSAKQFSAVPPSEYGDHGTWHTFSEHHGE